MIKAQVASWLAAAISRQNIALYDVPLEIEVPQVAERGDYATSVCLKLAKHYRKAPKQIAEDMCVALQADIDLNTQLFVEPLNGFINLKLQPAAMVELLNAELVYPDTDDVVLMEYVCANPTGPLHIGHGRWAALGSCMAALYSEIGVSVSRENYINDAGNQIALFNQSVSAVKAGKPVPEDGYHGTYVAELAKQDDAPVAAVLAMHNQTLDRVGAEFDDWYLESSLHDGKVSETLAWLGDNGFTYEKDGAIWFKSTDYGDDKDRVLVKSDGALTYFAVDIAYHAEKLKRDEVTQLLNIWGADHHGYVARMRAAVQAMQTRLSNREVGFEVIIGQLVRLFRDGEPVRMSKRTGEMITLDEVIEEIGVDATRFFLIQKSPDSTIDFDLSLAAKQSTENPIFYIQYAHARICRVFDKLGDAPEISTDACVAQLDSVDRRILQHLLRFNDEIYLAATQHAPHRLATYLQELAKLFHGFYEQYPVVSSSGDEQAFRVWVLRRVQSVLVKALRLLGLSAPSKM